MDDNGARAIASAIMTQAAVDYRDLRRRNMVERGTDVTGAYSIAEIEAFFYSPWCKCIIKGLGMSTNGRTLLSQLRSE